MVNNFNLISKFLTFESGDDFYFLQILKRKKENPEQTGNSRTIKTYYIDSLEKFFKLEKEIQTLCELHNARAYINLNKRSYEKIAFHHLKKVTDCLLNKDFKSIKDAYNSVCGSFSNSTEKRWIIDVDSSIEEATLIAHEIQKQSIENESNILGYIPTINGFHIITKPFNTQLIASFKIQHPFDIQKNNPTLLYYNKI